MALNVYVGSLTRYYAGGWESVTDRTGRERRWKAEAGQPRAAGVPKKDHERIQASVLTWRRTLDSALAPHLTEPLSWNESPEAPWFTDWMGWDGFGSLVLWAAYAEQPTLSRPAVLPRDWDDDAALVRSNADGFHSRFSHLVRNVELWLPTTLDFTFEAEDVDGRRVIVGSSTTLRCQLAELNAATWKMDEDEMSALARGRPEGDPSFEVSARQAMAVLSGLAGQAVKHRLPMKLDY
ncbi:hypothetical protein [Reyranella sp.]|uniref:hypothetical protein n=1 Tax=Reyranella sp. TaxID=1929291 RepID=UPI003D1220CA